MWDRVRERQAMRYQRKKQQHSANDCSVDSTVTITLHLLLLLTVHTPGLFSRSTTRVTPPDRPVSYHT